MANRSKPKGGEMKQDKHGKAAAQKFVKSNKDLLTDIKHLAQYWAEQEGDKQRVCNGLAFSILALLDEGRFKVFESCELGWIEINGELHDTYAKMK
jgi:hypothetical protein